ncbi:MAG: NAD-glutamate dehydrogenase [Gammaproteobacteria bacterium]|nr:NAD-glutamate dehydrogenase [Gammaproteobacteria bacterium]
MASPVSNRRQEIINDILLYLKKRVSAQQMPLLEAFAWRYYASSSISDLGERSIENLCGAFMSHWNFLYQRQPGESKVRIFNPVLEQDGWQSTHTIIEISHDDIPFLLDSTRMEINRNNLQIHFMIHFGGLKLKRNAEFQVTEVLPLGAIDPTATSEAPIYIEIDRITDPKLMEDLCANIQRVLADVRLSVVDWHKMVNRAEDTLLELEQNPPPLDPAEVAESKDFLRWLMNDNFTFLGSRDYKLIGNETNRALQIIPGTGLGVLRDESTSTISRRYAELPPQARKLALSKNILIIAKTNTRSTVHRMAYTDYIGVKRFNDQGELIGERRFIGLYTSSAYHTSPRHIPFLRHKVSKVMQELHFPPDSHNGKEALNVLETLPRDDLFQATQEDLVKLTMGILHIQERKRVRLFIRKDSYGRYFSCLVYVPRETFNTELCLNMQDVLMEALQGKECTFTTFFSDSVLARIHFLIRVNPRNTVEYDIDAVEQKLIDVARSWTDELKSQLVMQFGEADALKYSIKYAKAFPASYTEYYKPSTAINDISHIELLNKTNTLEMSFYKSSEKNAGTLRLKLFHGEHPIALSDVLPTLENMGLKVIGERPHEIIFKDGKIIWINDFDVVYVRGKEINVDDVKSLFQDAFANIWFKGAEDDGFNRLVLEAQLSWRETSVFRAYTKYLRQAGFTFSQNYIEQALVNNSGIAKKLIDLFNMRFTPNANRDNTATLIAQIEQDFEDVVSLDEDRILRKILEIILATLRTNYFQTMPDGSFKPYISFKFNPLAISDLPLPRPMFEIFVYSPRVEGVHLRGGKVARGGIRWSDRREDFRTEVLGLMKAQQVKNSVIVPVGAKGGFFPKQLPVSGNRDEILQEVIFCYSTFIRGLLDLTDNIKENVTVPPVDVVRYDEDDSYLVVAADKGTATFSDIANGISKEYGFWLDDAFASGGSAGYDHKKMGITARGAWESVKRHFREFSVDPSVTEFTVVGIGDMAGDVFGNGMLLSKKIKLLSAFNHMHIFIDPSPDPLVSFNERQRLFNLPRSAWSDYDATLISQGGGVFNRSAKSIKLTPEIKAAFLIEQDSMTPNDLIQAILKSPIDLLWNGGIGTFVKASYETHADAGDRTNDNIRIDGNQLRARMVGEGGNLGFTQLGRVEYALNGGIIYTDFIDNSAGVDCSDHEVNIKILLNKIIADGEMTLKERNKLLENMTDEVAELVLRDNYEQTQMLSLESSVGQQTMELFRRYMNELEKSGRLHRKLEFLPDDKILLERKAHNKGLTRPEIAVLLAYCKMYLKQDILNSDVPEDPYFVKYLEWAFPKPLRKKYLPQMKQHSLRREIIATQLSKNITDHMGINFVERLQRETGASVAFIMRAYVIAEAIYDLEKVWSQIESLDLKVLTSTQQAMMLQIYYLIRRATRWFLRNRKPNIDINATIAEFRPPIQELVSELPNLLTQTDKELLDTEIDAFAQQGVPLALAHSMASCNTLFTSLDIVEAARKNKFSISDIAKIYYELGNLLELNWLREQMNSYSMDNQWDELARSGFRDDLDNVQRKLSVSVLLLPANENSSLMERIENWIAENRLLTDRWQNLLAEIKSSNNPGFVTYSVVLRELHDFAQA